MRVWVVVAFTGLLSRAIPTPHEGHHGFPTPEFNETTIHDDDNAHPRPDHSHHSGTPLTEFNETQVLEGHAPDPLSYWAWDVNGDRRGFKSGFGDDAFDTIVYHGNSHGWLMIWHVVSYVLAFFVALPASELHRCRSLNQPLTHQ